MYIPRLLTKQIKTDLDRGKSILLLGPRQTGKTTMVLTEFSPDINFSFVKAKTRHRYESKPELFELELESRLDEYNTKPLIFVDEVQKIPAIMDSIQSFIDEDKAQFIISGSSARKLKHGPEINLLPGRVVSYSMLPLIYSEISEFNIRLDNLLLYGSLPAIFLEDNINAKEKDLNSYVVTYLEDEIRAEALVRNIGNFTRFLQIFAGETGKQLNFTRLSQDVGVSDNTIKNYYQILEDCMIANRIDPIIKTTTNRRLIHSPKYLCYDLGVRRLAAGEGLMKSAKYLADLFEQFIGNELLYNIKSNFPLMKLRYWRDSAGPEVDYVLEYDQEYIPIEVKWTATPGNSTIKHLLKFIKEYNTRETAYVVCQTPNKYLINKDPNIMALPWQEISSIFDIN